MLAERTLILRTNTAKQILFNNNLSSREKHRAGEKKIENHCFWEQLEAEDNEQKK